MAEWMKNELQTLAVLSVADKVYRKEKERESNANNEIRGVFW